MRSSRLASACVLLAALGGACVPASDAVAQRRAPGGIPEEILNASSSLSAQQVEAVESFASRRIEDLTSGSPEEVVEARDALIDPIKARPTPVFLRAYAEVLLPSISPLVSGDDSMRAENALRVVAFLKTPESAEMLISASDPKSVDDTGVRLVAAGLLSVACRADAQSAIPATTLVSMARSIAANVARESDWLVVLEELRAMQGIVRHPDMSDQSQKAAREILFDAFSELGSRIESSKTPSPLINAVYRAISDLRVQVAQGGNRNDFDASRVTAALREMLLHVARAAVTHWDALTEDLPTFRAYAITLTAGSQVYDVFDSSSQGSQLSRLDDPMNAYLEAVESLPGLQLRLDDMAAGDRDRRRVEKDIADAESTIKQGVTPLKNILDSIK